jgi:hypothetical protein
VAYLDAVRWYRWDFLPEARRQSAILTTKGSEHHLLRAV